MVRQVRFQGRRMYIPRQSAVPGGGSGPVPPDGPGFGQRVGDWWGGMTPEQRNSIKGTGFVLSGVPIALSAMNELNGDPTNPAANAAGAVASLGGGAIGGFVGGAMGSPFGPLGILAGRTIGGLAGSALAGPLGEGAVKALTSDPVAKEIANNERRAASALRLQELAAWPQLSIQMAAQRAADDSQARQATIAADLNARNAYMQALFGAATAPTRSYSDPNSAQMISNILSQGLV